jgi:hypothetical protein
MKWSILLAASLFAGAAAEAQAQPKTITFSLVVSTGAKGCLPNATGLVIDTSFGEFENLEVFVKGLPSNTGFDLFSIEVPNAPFGISSAGSISRLSSFLPASRPPRRRMSSRVRPPLSQRQK